MLIPNMTKNQFYSKTQQSFDLPFIKDTDITFGKFCNTKVNIQEFDTNLKKYFSYFTDLNNLHVIKFDEIVENDLIKSVLENITNLFNKQYTIDNLTDILYDGYLIIANDNINNKVLFVGVTNEKVIFNKKMFNTFKYHFVPNDDKLYNQYYLFYTFAHLFIDNDNHSVCNKSSFSLSPNNDIIMPFTKINKYVRPLTQNIIDDYDNVDSIGENYKKIFYKNVNFTFAKVPVQSNIKLATCNDENIAIINDIYNKYASRFNVHFVFDLDKIKHKFFSKNTFTYFVYDDIDVVDLFVLREENELYNGNSYKSSTVIVYTTNEMNVDYMLNNALRQSWKNKSNLVYIYEMAETYKYILTNQVLNQPDNKNEESMIDNNIFNEIISKYINFFTQQLGKKNIDIDYMISLYNKFISAIVTNNNFSDISEVFNRAFCRKNNSYVIYESNIKNVFINFNKSIICDNKKYTKTALDNMKHDPELDTSNTDDFELQNVIHYIKMNQILNAEYFDLQNINLDNCKSLNEIPNAEFIINEMKNKDMKNVINESIKLSESEINSTIENIVLNTHDDTVLKYMKSRYVPNNFVKTNEHNYLVATNYAYQKTYNSCVLWV